MNEREELVKALDNFGKVVAEELGLYKLLDWLTRWLENGFLRKLMK